MFTYLSSYGGCHLRVTISEDEKLQKRVEENYVDYEGKIRILSTTTFTRLKKKDGSFSLTRLHIKSSLMETIKYFARDDVDED